MNRFNQFILVALVPSATKPGRTEKIPCHYQTGATASAHDPANWVSRGVAEASAAYWNTLAQPNVRYCVGFVFTPETKLFFLDIDHALQPDNTWSQLSVNLINQFPGAYVELGQSGTGFHIIGSYTGPEPTHGCRNTPLGLELYTSGRFMALGQQARGDSSTDHTMGLYQMIASLFEKTAGEVDPTWRTGPVDEWRGPTNDDDLIRRARQSRSARGAFGGSASFDDLWTGNAAALSVAYPDTGGAGRAYDASSADAALAQHLAFWTGNDSERIRRLMTQSSLVRDKWGRDDYLPRTIDSATSRQTQWCRDAEVAPIVPAGIGGVPVPPAPVPGAVPVPPVQGGALVPGNAAMAARPVAGDTFLNADQQIQLFQGCCYVTSAHRILTPTGLMLDQPRFNATYGGFSFSMDQTNERVVRSAWECFLESQAVRFPKVAGCCFKPELPFGQIVTSESDARVNVYIPIETKRIKGDVTPMLAWLEKILPDARDRMIMLSYMAACIQYKGKKFQWWPVIQGAEGNGKTILIRILRHAIGLRYSHLPNATEMANSDNKFNGWIECKLFIGIEEIYVANRRGFLESFKTTITNDEIQIERKGVDQHMGENRANGMMATNHDDGVPVTTDNRRYSIFYTRQQSRDDIIRDGMTGSYFPDMYDWLNGEGRWAPMGDNYGYAICNEYLSTFQIPDEFNPATLCQVAPKTSSSQSAITNSLGEAEQSVLEMVKQGQVGFKGDWISSMALEKLMSHNTKSYIPRNRRRTALLKMGYHWHPGLKEGRMDRSSIVDGGGRPALFIKIGSPHEKLTSPEEICRAYQTDQQ